MTYEKAQQQTSLMAEAIAEKAVVSMFAQYDLAESKIKAAVQKVYAKYLVGVDPKQWYAELVKFGRLEKHLSEVQAILSEASRASGKEIVNASKFSMENAYNVNQYIFTTTRPEIAQTFIDPKLVDYTATGQSAKWAVIGSKAKQRYSQDAYTPPYGTLSEILMKNKTDDIVRVQRSITTGYINGYSNDQMSKQIQKDMNTSKYNADRIVRTETGRLSAAGDYAAYTDLADQGVNIRKEWIAYIDGRTRPEHKKLNHKRVGVDEYFHIGSDFALYPHQFAKPANSIHCRCTTIAVFEDDTAKEGKDNVINMKDYTEWAENNKVSLDADRKRFYDEYFKSKGK
jgi:SPP1 gp7 family putative phage head morphogenesis protein